jgi:hypothetical protein
MFRALTAIVDGMLLFMAIAMLHRHNVPTDSAVLWPIFCFWLGCNAPRIWALAKAIDSEPAIAK